jgi:DNA-3-methyladenine glycosylase II
MGGGPHRLALACGARLAAARAGASRIVKPAYWDNAASALAAGDAVLAGLIARHPDVHLARRGDPFTVLARAIVGQQISVKAAQSIWDRFAYATGARDEPVALDAGRVGRTRMATLRRVGFSERKAQYLRDLARHFTSGQLDPREWAALDDETLIALLVDVKGIGRWTAEMFLIFHELRPDVLPVDDIGLQKAVAEHYHDGERLAPKALREFGVRWAPYRSVATWYLWRALDPIPVEY